TDGVDFTAADKQSIAKKLDELGIDYIEGGFPGANPTDDEFFSDLPKLKKSHISAFGMTRRLKTSAENDPGLASLVNSGAKHCCIVGKTWDFHVTKALGVKLDENLQMIGDSIAYINKRGCEAMFDAEHFFDGYKKNPQYAMQAIESAYKSGARWIVLCDTNGGTLPHEIEEIVSEVIKKIPGENLGIHCHNDTANAVANSIAAVRAGVRQVQGTLNGVGERCGNANLVSIIPTLILKMGFKTGITKDGLKHLTKISRFLDDRLNRQANNFAPYVGKSAFAHKGGLHVSAVAKDPSSYEHINPELVGNTRQILISDQAGRSNIVSRLKDIGMDPKKYTKDQIGQLIDTIKQHESQGYAYDSADASFELLARHTLENIPQYFRLESFRVTDERRWNNHDELEMFSEATVKANLDGESLMAVAEGNGPVNALDKALRNALGEKYPELKEIKLIDYKVRIINSGVGTGATTRVLIESEDEKGQRWVTIGVSANIIDASYNALRDSLKFKLLREKVNL
ncbi:citramalate synthase, partial [Rickettsiales bacterium]|nr:citramalate synthase [Rickettsiales bacterium]